MITASDLRMVQQKHQEQYDALKQRLSEVEAEREKAEERVLDGERWITDLRAELTSLRADQERMREALNSIANSSCCWCCQEAALVARAALSTPRQP